jgi:diguanylate cyclase (GGDEF)-like protein/PAS domain S-box-containing protein
MWVTVQAGQTWSGEFCDRAKNGSLIWFKAIVIPWKDRHGDIESFTTIAVDVTDQKSAEVELKRAHARLEAFVKHAPAAVAMFDNDMRYVAHTERWLNDYALKQKSLVGLNHYDVFPEVPVHWREKHQRLLRGGAAERSDEERFRRADGSENIIRWEVRSWYMPDGTVGGIIMLTEEITERKKIQDKLWKLAKLDPLTELPNRLLFNETLRDAIAAASDTGSLIAVALIDLDHFKEINDTLGHDAGDDLLKVVAARLRNVLDGAGTIARLGGDEFAVLIPGQENDESIHTHVAAIESTFEDPINLSGTLRSCSASIGVTLFPRDASQPSDLLKNADLALYRAKSLGRGRAQIFTPDLREAIDRRVELQENVLDAIQRDEFVLYFQPIMPSDLTEPPSFEALLRWRHPMHGLLSPGSFEEVLEDPKVALAIGNRVIDLALEQAASWQRDGFQFGRVAVNVTSADFAFGCFATRLKRKLGYFKVEPSRLCIEVTERVFLGSGALHVSEALEQLHELGVEIALDDFGTGYASLSHIKAYPIGRLKIDRSFVKDMQSNKDSLSIVQTIVQLGRGLGLCTTAEGVETEEQVMLLSSMGCGSLQGYYFARPLAAMDVPQFLLDKSKFGALVA